jgi:O-antigen ligase
METESLKSIAGKASREHWLTALVCLHAAFLAPYVILVPGERTNVFTSVLLFLLLLQLVLFRLRKELWAAFPWRTVLPWLLLTAGLAVSALASSNLFPAALRAFAFIGPAAAGLVCGYGLFRSQEGRQFLFPLLTFCYAGLTLSHLFFGAMPSFMGLHHHALAGTLLLLSAGPIRLAGHTSRLWRGVAGILLVLGAVVCFMAGSRFVILLPFVLIPVYVAFKSISLRQAALGGVVSSLVAGVFFTVFPGKVPRAVNYESTFYRVEAFPATWEILKQYPLLGVGIRTPRRPFLESFEPVSGMVSRDGFLAVVDRNVTWDNQYLSLLCGVGVPLTLLYLFLAGRLLATYLRRAWRQEIDHATERAVSFALLASVIHFAVHDGLFYPQISWFFHLLLGVGAYYLPGEAPSLTPLRQPAEPDGLGLARLDGGAPN